MYAAPLIDNPFDIFERVYIIGLQKDGNPDSPDYQTRMESALEDLVELAYDKVMDNPKNRSIDDYIHFTCAKAYPNVEKGRLIRAAAAGPALTDDIYQAGAAAIRVSQLAEEAPVSFALRSRDGHQILLEVRAADRLSLIADEYFDLLARKQRLSDEAANAWGEIMKPGPHHTIGHVGRFAIERSRANKGKPVVIDFCDVSLKITDRLTIEDVKRQFHRHDGIGKRANGMLELIVADFSLT